MRLMVSFGLALLLGFFVAFGFCGRSFQKDPLIRRKVACLGIPFLVLPMNW